VTETISPICHVLIIEDTQGRRTFMLETAHYSLGRHSSNSIVICSKQISRQHATIIRKNHAHSENNSFFIIDGDGEGYKSHNGFFVNGKKCLIHELQDGDLINFGGDANASYHRVHLQTVALNAIATGSNLYAEVNNIARDRPASQLALKTKPSTEAVSKSKTTLKLADPPQTPSNDEDTLLKPMYRDWLTQLANRTLFNEHLSLALANAKEKQQQIAIIYLDIEHFGAINERLGYSIGDRLLKEFAERLNGCLRAGDVVARWGGDEFTILLKQVKSTDDPTRVSQRILDTLKNPFVLDDKQVYLRCHMGIAIYPQNGEEGMTLLEVARLNLDNSKKQPVATARSPVANPQLSRIESILHKALEKEEFALHYQPQVNINTGEIYGMEALLRWHHPKLGTILPHQFLANAEKTKAIVAINQWVLQTACRQNRAWQISGLPYFPIAVNLSPRQFQQPKFAEMLARVLSQTNLEPYWLELEITEATVMHNLQLTRQAFEQLSQLGVPVSIDDFGLGYSPIGYLQEFPFSKLKIAQSCVKQLQHNPQKTAIVAAAIALGKTFNLRVVAEGVETQQQLDLLRSLHCEEMQGYCFSQPLSSQQATQFLAHHWIVRKRL
jgi:diguanylate cyclase (GGDEF)-like protein